jgi:hypothetical protein
MVYPTSSYSNLEFLIPFNWQEGMKQPRKFIVFFDNIKDTEGAQAFFEGQLLCEHHTKIAYFHSTMSQQYHEQTLKCFCKGEMWGLFCTNAFGLVSRTPETERRLLTPFFRKWMLVTLRSLSSTRQHVIFLHCGNVSVDWHSVREFKGLGCCW